MDSATTSQVQLTVNGKPVTLELDNRTSLLDLLREHLGLTGTKKGCNQGACGACTVLVDDRSVNACLTLAAMCQGASVTTIEGISENGRPHPLQEAFIRHDAMQCGYCTPGQIMSGIACIKAGETYSAHAVREFMSGNLCRCGAYQNIVAAVLEVAEQAGGRR